MHPGGDDEALAPEIAVPRLRFAISYLVGVLGDVAGGGAEPVHELDRVATRG